MIGTIRKHQAWLWYLIIAVTIVTFVGFLSPSSRRGGYGDSSHADFGAIDGKPVSREAYRDAMLEEHLDFRLRYGQWPSQEEQLRQMGYDITQKTYQRLFMNAKADDLKIEVSDQALLRRIRQLFGLGADQVLPPEQYREFVGKELMPNGCTQFDFERFVRHAIAHEQLVSLYGMSGDLVTPKEAEAFYRRENEPISTSVAFFKSTNFISQVTVTPQALQEYYTNNAAKYRIPESVDVEYVKFNKTNFYSEVPTLVTNLDQMVNGMYSEKGAAAFKDKDGKQMSEAEAKALIKNQITDTGALTLARKKAQGFINDIYNQITTNFTADAFAKAAAEKSLTVSTTGAFDASTGPKNLKVTAEFVQAAFSLSANNRNDPTDKSGRSLMYKKPLSGEDGAYVIVLKQRTPSRLPGFEEVKADVTKDFKEAKGTELATAAGEKFEAAVTNGLAAGKSFADICAAASVKPVDLPLFSLSTRVYPELEKEQFQELQHVVGALPVGKASGFVPGFEGGFVAFVKNRQAVDPEKMKTELSTFTEQLRASRQGAAFNEWFQKNYPIAVRRPATTKSEG